MKASTITITFKHLAKYAFIYGESANSGSWHFQPGEGEGPRRALHCDCITSIFAKVRLQLYLGEDEGDPHRGGGLVRDHGDPRPRPRVGDQTGVVVPRHLHTGTQYVDILYFMSRSIFLFK